MQQPYITAPHPRGGPASLSFLPEVSAVMAMNPPINRKLRMAIKADKNVPYGLMDKILKVLQETNTLRFNLVTELETTDFEIQTAPTK